jgi:hypothetical protein
MILKVSFMDYILGNTKFLIPSIPKDYKISSSVPNGWAHERDISQEIYMKEDPYLKFNALEFFLDAMKLPIKS